MRENFDQEFDKLVDFLKDNPHFFEEIDVDLGQLGLKQRIDIELEEFSDMIAEKKWTQEDIKYLYVTVCQLFENEITTIIEIKNYELGFLLSRYLYNKLLPIGSQKYFISYNKDFFELFHDVWKVCYNNGNYRLKKEIKQWLEAEREDIESVNAVGQWRTIYLIMYNGV